MLKEKIVACMPVIPFAAHWLLPDGMESRLFVPIFGVPFFVFNILYFLYFLSYKKAVKRNPVRIDKKVRTFTFVMITLLFLISLLNGAINNIDDLELLLIDNQSLICASFTFIVFPMNDRMVKSTKYVLIPTMIILCLEVLLFSLGLMTYRESLGSEDYMGVVRIATTVGEATGTGVALVMLGVLVLYYDTNTIIKFILIFLVTMAILFTISRGSFIVWFAYLIIYCYKKYLKGLGLLLKIKSAILVTIFGGALFLFGAFDPLLARNESLDGVGTFGTGREDKIESGLKLYNESNYMGVGPGQTNMDKSLSDIVRPRHHIGIHNYYITVLTELGVLGFVIVLSYLLFLVSFFDFQKMTSFFSIIMLLLFFSIEPVFTFAEFMMPAFFIIMISLKKKNATLFSSPLHK